MGVPLNHPFQQDVLLQTIHFGIPPILGNRHILGVFDQTIYIGIHLPYGYDIHSSPWKDPPFLRTVNHLFRLGPWLNHGHGITRLATHSGFPIWDGWLVDTGLSHINAWLNYA